ncbi:MAG: DUF4402 domain-containing protein [Phenylobacterium sp.]|uniref:DUF4402 domain-containing protein n=1 Tax=Phenylobacterium sp. TaxID=1871053 RepID=UPI001A3A0E59|nr:DUF4402 domain-containing protein [Phenylobacterium sp.]MBL8773192.1 DUF4402 domain-containing protein [Phenylobacterium sp.]
MALGGPAASVAANYTLNITGPMDIGTVAAAASGDTVFRIDAGSGAVSVASGAGRRISTASARAQVNVTCRPSRAADTDCTTRTVRIRIGTIGALTGRARAFSTFYVANGTASIVAPPSGVMPITLELAPLGNNSARNFFVGADFPVAGDESGLASGNGENAFYVYVVNATDQMIAGDTDKGRVRALRSVSVSSTSNLGFGRIQRPTTGTNTITLNATSGARTMTGGGNAFAYPTPAPTRGAFTIAGEGGQQVSISVPSNLTLSGPADLGVVLTDTAPATRNLSGALGAAGTYSFTVGGSFTLNPTTPVGTYSGVLTVTVDYN